MLAVNAVVTLAILATQGSSPARAASSAAHGDDDAPTFLDRLRVREESLAERRGSSLAQARQQLWAAYRLGRRRDIGFLALPERRLDDAQAQDLALRVAGRSLAEARAYARELEQVRGERALMEARSAQLAADAGDPLPAGPPGTRIRSPRLRAPVKGTMVAAPGERVDPASKVALHTEGVQILARMNQPAIAAAGGVVRAAVALPQGGFAVALAHADGWVSIVSGLRELYVSPGEPVEGGQTLGLVGRNLDGAPVVTVEIWHRRRPVDPRRLLR